MYFAKSQIHLAAEVYQKLTVQPDAASSSVNRVEGDLLQAFIDSEGNDDDESVGHVDDNAVPPHAVATDDDDEDNDNNYYDDDDDNDDDDDEDDGVGAM